MSSKPSESAPMLKIGHVDKTPDCSAPSLVIHWPHDHPSRPRRR